MQPERMSVARRDKLPARADSEALEGATRVEGSQLEERSEGTPAGETAVAPPAAGDISIFTNAASLMVSRVAVAAMGWLGTLLIVRHLSVTDWGRFSFVFGLLGIMTVITNMANPRVVFRELTKDDGRIAGTYVMLRLALGILAYVVALCFVIAGHYPSVVVEAMAIAGLVAVVASTASGYDVIFEFRMALSNLAVAATVGQAAQLVLTVILVFTYRSIIIFTIPAVLCEVVAIAWKLFRLPRYPAVRYGFLWRQWIELLKLSVPLALGGAITTIYYNLDTVMLSKMQTFRAVGIYGIAYKFAGIVAIVGSAMWPSLFPILVRYWPEKIDRFRVVVSRSIRLYLVLGALVTVEFTVFAANAITLLYGHHYVVGAAAARLVVASECLGFFVTLAIVALVAMNRNVTYPLAAFGGLALNLGLNLWVIPRWSYNGAAWDTLATEIFVFLIVWIALTRAAGRNLVEFGPLLGVVLSSGAAVGVAFGLGAVSPWPVAAVAAACAYVAALFVTRVGGDGGLRAVFVLDGKDTVAT